MNRGLMLIALFAAIGVGLYYYVQPSGSSITGAGEIAIQLERRRMEPPIVRAEPGQALVLQIRTDEEGTVRFQNYDASAVLALGRSVELPFLSQSAGTFAIFFYPDSAPNQRIQVGTVEVTTKQRGW